MNADDRIYERLRRHLDPRVQLIVGGWGSRRVRGVLDQIGAAVNTRLQDLPETVDRLLTRAPSAQTRGEGMDDQSIAS